MTNKEILIHLSLIQKIGPATVNKLLESLNSKGIDLINIYNFDLKDLVNYTNLNINTCNLIYNGLKDKSILDIELESLEKNRIYTLSILDADYPLMLKNIYLPPVILYIKSSENFKFDDNGIAIVGSRNNDSYGAFVVNNIVPELAKNRYTIVSGGAYGIDTLAHRSAINSGGKTIAILGSGLLRLYPKDNIELFNKILVSGGALVSPYSLYTAPMASNFPARNRIIAGLSKLCLVVQADQKSGALITANYALEQGKEVCAIPGAINNSLSFGCNKLISQGAHLISNVNDILSLLGDYKPNLVNIDRFSIENNMEVQNSNNNIYDKIIDLCKNPISFDELLLKLNLEFSELQDFLFELELKGRLIQNYMGLWLKKI